MSGTRAPAAPGRAPDGERTAPLEIRAVSPDWAPALGAFFEALRAGGDERFFHPHPLTVAQARVTAGYVGLDLYYVLTEGSQVIGYAMLRGWDEGYAVPSLGIALHPDARGSGLASPFMAFLHAAARRRGAPRVRLKVYRENARAVALYEALGYEFEPTDGDELLGHLTL